MTPPDIPDDEALNSLAQRLAQSMRSGQRVATAESCTGGFIAQTMTAVSGSSAWFECGYVTYSNAAKMRDLSVPESEILTFGAVSEPVAKSMAYGAMQRAGVWAAVAVTGIAGPSGGSEDKPVGTVCFGWAWQTGAIRTERLVLPGDRDAVRRATVAHAIQGLIPD